MRAWRASSARTTAQVSSSAARCEKLALAALASSSSARRDSSARARSSAICWYSVRSSCRRETWRVRVVIWDLCEEMVWEVVRERVPCFSLSWACSSWRELKDDRRERSSASALR